MTRSNVCRRIDYLPPGLLSTGKAQGLLPRVEETCREARLTWASLCFTGMAEQRLRRYFSYQLLTLNECLDELALAPGLNPAVRGSAEAVLVEQAGHLLLYFSHYTDDDIPATGIWQRRQLGELHQRFVLLYRLVTGGQLSPGLVSCLLPYLEQIRDGCGCARFTYRQFRYAGRLADTLLSVLYGQADELEGSLAEALIHLNFNALTFLLYCRERLLAGCNGLPEDQQLELLRQSVTIYRAVPENAVIAYDPQWPAISQMLLGSVAEDIHSLEIRISRRDKTAAQKLRLNLSVAQLACLLRVFYEEQLLGQPNLSDLFRFIAGHYRTKRQQTISSRSLSKEFYSIDQVTAAVTRGYLQQMVARINKYYFPVWVAAGVWLCAG